MFRPTVVGLGACGIGLVILIFDGIRSMMTAGEVVMHNSTLVSLLGDERLAWVNDISWSMAKNGLSFLVNAPLFAVVIAVGVILLIVSMISK